ncbi:MAG: PilZ domain-containing protein [Proteobacteria bacterium]|nr:PilZ domain-containing protein [Pseudomonadota bacterium]
MTAASTSSQAPRSGPCRRAYFRVSTALPVRMSRVPAGEEEALALRIRTGPAAARPVAEGPLADQLRSIEGKLDRVLVALGLEQECPVGETDRRPLVLSGAGLSFVGEERFAVGESVRVELLPGDGTPLPVLALARVVRADADGLGQHRIALTFAAIHESDRDRLVQHVYAVERGRLRGGRAASPGA